MGRRAVKHGPPPKKCKNNQQWDNRYVRRLYVLSSFPAKLYCGEYLRTVQTGLAVDYETVDLHLLHHVGVGFAFVYLKITCQAWLDNPLFFDIWRTLSVYYDKGGGGEFR